MQDDPADRFRGRASTCDAGLILVRELDERLGPQPIIAEHLRDSRHGLNTQVRLPDLMRQSICSRLAGYEDLNDAGRLVDRSDVSQLIGSPEARGTAECGAEGEGVFQFLRERFSLSPRATIHVGCRWP